MKSMLMDNRLHWLDAIKGVGILLIMLSHLFSFQHLGAYLYCGYIPLFFIASGYTLRIDDYQSFIKKKACRLLMPYLIYGILATVFFFFISRHVVVYQGGEVHEWIGLVYSRYCLFQYGEPNNIYFLPIEASSPLWFLTALFTGFLAYCLFGLFTHKWLVVAIGSLITIGLQYCPVLLPWSLDICFMVVLFLCVGEFFRDYNVIGYLNKYRNVVLIISLLLYWLLVYENGGCNLSVRQYGNCGVISPVLFVLASVFYFVIVWYVVTISRYIQKFFSILGVLSMQLMCIQMPVFFVVKKIGSHLNVEYSITCTVAIVAVISIAYLIRLITQRYSGKIVLLSYL